ncbi:hypothetical protein NP493_489g02013 [Ridgeia piscesae]|uniref:Uncharacterized protein n=1 Tax=Ridgeia piscesae TaxID=27915 RepID=A0AAD9KZ37_RIDPI|nr:hypothetical protein NP493_489g02013 [Ridgeia piscesae]
MGISCSAKNTLALYRPTVSGLKSMRNVLFFMSVVLTGTSSPRSLVSAIATSPGPASEQSTSKYVDSKVFTGFSIAGPETFTLRGLLASDTFTLDGLLGTATPPYDTITVCLMFFFGMYRQLYVPSLLSFVITSTALQSASSAAT